MRLALDALAVFFASMCAVVPAAAQDLPPPGTIEPRVEALIKATGGAYFLPAEKNADRLRLQHAAIRDDAGAR